MKNLNEPRKNFPVEQQSDAQVVSIESRREKTEREGPLIAKRELEELRSRWTVIQASFVDNPRQSLQEAHGLVSSALQQIEDSFRDQQSQLEKQWSKGTDVSTEDLRVALQHYRTFFDRLLSL